jgi:hypothetical protein
LAADRRGGGVDRAARAWLWSSSTT